MPQLRDDGLTWTALAAHPAPPPRGQAHVYAHEDGMFARWSNGRMHRMGGVFPDRVTLFTDVFDVVAGNASLTRAATAGMNHRYSYYAYQGTQAVNDDRQAPFECAAGTYSIFWYGAMGTNTGIITVRIDGGSVGTMDLYVNPGAHNETKSITGVAITAGRHTLSLLMATKHASSTAYFNVLTKMWLTRTGP
jgi:hypothetical protein